MIFSFSRSRDRRRQPLRRRWTLLPKPMTRPPPPTLFVDLAHLFRVTRLPPSPSSVFSAKQKENLNLTVEICSSKCPPRKLHSTGIEISGGGGGGASCSMVSSSRYYFLFLCFCCVWRRRWWGWLRRWRCLVFHHPLLLFRLLHWVRRLAAAVPMSAVSPAVSPAAAARVPCPNTSSPPQPPSAISSIIAAPQPPPPASAPLLRGAAAAALSLAPVHPIPPLVAPSWCLLQSTPTPDPHTPAFLHYVPPRVGRRRRCLLLLFFLLLLLLALWLLFLGDYFNQKSNKIPLLGLNSIHCRLDQLVHYVLCHINEAVIRCRICGAPFGVRFLLDCSVVLFSFTESNYGITFDSRCSTLCGSNLSASASSVANLLASTTSGSSQD